MLLTGCLQLFSQTMTYQNDAIGWQISYPAEWIIQTSEEIAMVENMGKEALEEVVDDELPMDHTNLLWLKKDAYNSFTSTTQPWQKTQDEDFESSQQDQFESIIKTFKNKGLHVEHLYGKHTIDGLEFLTLENHLYFKSNSTYLMSQIIFVRLIEGETVFTLAINWNDEDIKRELLGMVESSTFEKRD
jgi:hypothetical protein